MKPHPRPQAAAPQYPDTTQHQLGRRQFLTDLAKAAAGFGLSVMAVSSIAGDVVQEAATPATAADLLAAKVDLLIKDLRSAQFKVRKAAIARLIATGKGDGKDKAADARARELVLAKMTTLTADKDPEVAAQAKAVILALNPKTGTPPDDGIAPAGGIPAPQIRGRIAQ